MVPAVSFVGWSGCGKTTFLKKVIRELKERGLSLGVVKNTSHPVEIDIPGKDTWNFAREGADTVILNGPNVFSRQEQVAARKDIFHVLEGLSAHDLILIEGARDGSLPKVEVWRETCGKGHRVAPHDIIALVADGNPGPGYENVPCFGIDEIKEFVEFLLQKVQISCP